MAFVCKLFIMVSMMLMFFEIVSKDNIISMMRIKWSMAAMLLICFVKVNCAQWYQQGHQDFLDWPNFDSTVQQPGKYKFVKFFTRNCRYCRLLKQVEEQLREEKQWSFEFYDVDCSIHYDLCVTKAAMSAFPYVAIYNTEGKLHGTIGGYYPLQTMKEAFNTIQTWQAADLQSKPQAPMAPLQTEKRQNSQKEEKPMSHNQEHQNDRQQKIEQTPSSTEHKDSSNAPSNQQKSPQKQSIDEDERGWSESVKDGIKMAIILLGVIIFNKTISPYLQSQKEDDDYSKPRILEIPFQRQSTTEIAKGDPECSNLLRDTL